MACAEIEPTMHINHAYILDFAERYRGGKKEYRILDYGCGAGEAVIAGRERDIDIYGAEVFYEGGNTRAKVESSGILGTAVREIVDGKIDFPDGYFDLVISNQVFEHVEDLDKVLSEIHRILKPGGATLNLFPSKDVWREGHCGIPFIHWFSRKSRIRYSYALFLRRLGFGYFKKGKSPGQWTRDFLAWLDTYCYYRDRNVILQAFRRFFSIRLIEDDYIRFRLEKSRLKFLRPIVRMSLARTLIKKLYRKLGGLVLFAIKSNDAGGQSGS